jgi:hypothetical protein
MNIFAETQPARASSPRTMRNLLALDSDPDVMCYIGPPHATADGYRRDPRRFRRNIKSRGRHLGRRGKVRRLCRLDVHAASPRPSLCQEAGFLGISNSVIA